MDRFRFITAGESHGPSLGAVVEGVPAGLVLASSPGPGTAVGARTPVTMVVSLGAGTTGATAGVAGPSGTAGTPGTATTGAPGTSTSENGGS